jgi:MFS family permease
LTAGSRRGRSRWLIDLGPLRESRQYRLLYAGQVVSGIGTQLTVVAAAVQVFALTGSSFQVGLVSLGQFVPLVVMSLVGGSLADAMDRRRLLVVANVLQALTTLGLAVNASLDRPRLWPLYLCTALSAGFSGLDDPTRSAAMPTLIRRELIPAAAALNQVTHQLSSIVGPALAGVLLARVSTAAAFWTDVGTFGLALVALALARPMLPEGGGTRAGGRSVLEGLGFLRSQRAVQGGFLIDIDAMVLGMPRALFPELGQRAFAGGPGTVGLLYAAPAVGAAVGALTTGWVSSVRRPGRAVVVAVLAWGAAIALFGVSPWLWLALVWLAVAGWADVISAVFRGTILQMSVPDRLRGRLSALNIAVVAGGPRLGDMEAGAVASVSSPQISAVTGGLACMVGAVVVARRRPELPAWIPPTGGRTR